MGGDAGCWRGFEARASTCRCSSWSGVQTPIAFVTVSADGEPSYELHGSADRTLETVLDGPGAEAMDDSAALFFSTNTLVDADERAGDDGGARARRCDLDRPVIFDANLRLHRWDSRADAAANANACVPGALLVRANRAEAAAMTGETDPERAAAALVAVGARLVVLTLGARGRDPARRAARPTRPPPSVRGASTRPARGRADRHAACRAGARRLSPSCGRGRARRGGRGSGTRVRAVGCD